MFKLFCTILLCLGLAVPLAAQRSEGSFEYSAGVGAYYFDKHLIDFLSTSFAANGNKNQFVPAAGARVGYNVNRHVQFGVGVIGGRSFNNFGAFGYKPLHGSEVKFLTPSADLTLTANVNARFSPFVSGGTQFTRVTGNGNVTHPTWGAFYGAGFRLALSKYVMFKVEARRAAEHFAELPNAKTAWNNSLIVGLSLFTNGREKPAIQYAPSKPDTVRILCDCAPATVEIKDTLVLEGVNFEFDSPELTSAAMDILDRVADALNKSQWLSVKFEIAGHTSSIGSTLYNQALSQARAESVQNYLASRGVSASRMNAVGYGESQPRFPEAREGDNPLNRRVELRKVGS